MKHLKLFLFIFILVSFDFCHALAFFCPRPDTTKLSMQWIFAPLSVSVTNQKVDVVYRAISNKNQPNTIQNGCLFEFRAASQQLTLSNGVVVSPSAFSLVSRNTTPNVKGELCLNSSMVPTDTVKCSKLTAPASSFGYGNTILDTFSIEVLITYSFPATSLTTGWEFCPTLKASSGTIALENTVECTKGSATPSATCNFSVPSSLDLGNTKPNLFNANGTTLVNATSFPLTVSCPSIATVFTPKVTMTYSNPFGLTCWASNSLTTGSLTNLLVRIYTTDSLNNKVPFCPQGSSTPSSLSFPKSTANALYNKTIDLTAAFENSAQQPVIAPGSFSTSAIFTVTYN